MENKTGTTWGIDPTHSEVQFKVRHLVISTVTGQFQNFEGSISTASEDFDGAKVSFKLDVNSISTGQTDRDNHLKSDDFFNSEEYPAITLSRGILHKQGESTYDLKGDLTIRDITQPVSLEVELGGLVTDPYGNEKAGFEINGVVNRKEFGLKWDAVTEAGSVVVGEDVKLHLNIQVAKS